MLTDISLTNFKNYNRLEEHFSEPIICFSGSNGSGKTNLLDAIYYLCIGKSYFSRIEQQVIQHNQPFLRVVGKYSQNGQEDEIVIISPTKDKKKVSKNKIEYERLSDHLGFAPICFVAPDDSKLILGQNEERRRFLNVTLSQIEPDYVSLLTNYRRIVKQKQSLLKQFAVNRSLLQAYNEQLAPLGEQIFKIRKRYIDSFRGKMKTIYQKISLGKEQADIDYHAGIKEGEFLNQLHQAREKEIASQRALVGTHRDNLSFMIQGHDVKTYGSQGQQKTYLLALKLAELEMLGEVLPQKPYLLLDDIFDKLDRERVEELFRFITQLSFAQLFITDTDGERMNKLLSKFERTFAVFEVEDNQLHAYERK